MSAELERLRRSNASLRGHMGRLRKELREEQARGVSAALEADEAAKSLARLTRKTVALGLRKESLDDLAESLRERAEELEEEESQNEAAITLMARLKDREDQLEDVIEERVAEIAGRQDDMARREAEIKRKEDALERSRKFLEKDRERYNKTRKEIRAEVEENLEFRVAEKARAEEHRANSRIAAAEAKARAAIDGAECTRINQLNVLCNRLASELSKHKPAAQVLWDYLEQTNQITGYSGRKDCTDTDLARIREAHAAARKAYLSGPQ